MGICVDKHLCLCVSMCVYVYVCICMYMCMCVCMCVCVSVCVCVYVFECMYAPPQPLATKATGRYPSFLQRSVMWRIYWEFELPQRPCWRRTMGASAGRSTSD
jgi:hypothetical protein